MCYQSQQRSTFGNSNFHSKIHKRAKWTKVPDCVKPQIDPATLFKAALYLVLTLLVMFISSCVHSFFSPSITSKIVAQNFVSKGIDNYATLINFNEKYLILSVMLTIVSPAYWNILCRYEYYTKNLSKLAGSPSTALSFFAASILAFSSFREWAFFQAVGMQPSIELYAIWIKNIVYLIGYFLIIVGFILSMTAFYKLGIFGTYMGEYFGFMFDQKIESFPFNYFCDPMYFGSTIMHVGHSLLSASPTGMFLSTLLGFTYWLAARCFEGPFMNAMYTARDNLVRQSS